MTVEIKPLKFYFSWYLMARVEPPSRSGRARWQQSASTVFGPATSEEFAHSEDTSAYKEWHLIYTVVDNMHIFQFLKLSLLDLI